MKEALLYEKAEGLRVKCGLCPHECLIPDTKKGICGVRQNWGGVLYSNVYGRVAARNIDPIEKKPLFHFHPASSSYSIATVGCNLRCMHCQNFDISQYPKHHEDIPGIEMTPGQVAADAAENNCASIAYTYTEPTIFFEFALDCAMAAKEQGIKNVFVSNGFTARTAVEMISPYLDAINIDLKGDEDFYKKVEGARLGPVLDSISLYKGLGIWVEVTTLVIPGYNDSDDFLNWAAGFINSVDPAIPWHVTGFYPAYQMPDVTPTPMSTLRRAREIGLKSGLKYVYTGNLPGDDGENTRCSSCRELLIERKGFFIKEINLKSGRCPSCGQLLDGVGLP
ncbi:MAG: AmmeMemoRadiSam system radical SAM enzyme [Nitrospiraceae bacterium]|nr:AmmeMemoRadiSam system radical SAM enzyme [Nitrospiraceae bacterium]